MTDGAEGQSLLIRNVRVVTVPAGQGYRRGAEAGRLEVRPGVDVRVQGGRVDEVGPDLPAPEGAQVVEGQGRALVPGFVDAHTHACWAGERLDEWEGKLQGASYQELLRKGGGILATVRAVREATEVELTESLLRRLHWMLEEGTTAVEVKSGYGLETEAELKMLRAIRRAGESWPGHVTATACIGHARDPEVPDFVDRTVEETLPAVSEAFPEVAVDAYCEDGAWSLEECLNLFRAARERGHPIRVHADQFNALGMVTEAVGLGALSVDHLEATEAPDLEYLAGSRTAGVLLPVSGFHLDDRYADGRTFVDAGGAPVVATNWNPGSAPSPSMPLAMALAVRKNGLTPHEALTAVTANAAQLLDLPDWGRIGPGARADLVLLRHNDERELAHTVGGSPVAAVICGGRLVEGPAPPSGG